MKHAKGDAVSAAAHRLREGRCIAVRVHEQVANVLLDVHVELIPAFAVERAGLVEDDRLRLGPRTVREEGGQAAR